MKMKILKKNKKKIYFNGRKNLITRCINNLLDNSIKYAEKISVNLEKKLNYFYIN